MKLLKIIIIIFLALTIEINADTEKEIINNLQKGGNLIFIRHAYAPGNGDPENFDINNCETQRNLSQSGRLQSKKIGNFFKENDIPIKLLLKIIKQKTFSILFIALNLQRIEKYK